MKNNNQSLKDNFEVLLTTNNLKKNIFRYLQIIFGSFLVAFAISGFLIPTSLVPGGFSGIANLISKSYTDIHLSVIFLYLNIPLIIFSFLVLGVRFGIRGIVTTLSIVIFCQLLKPIEGGFTKDIILNTIAFSVLTGLGTGLVSHGGSHTAGTDIIATVFNYYMKFFSTSRWLIIIDCIIVFMPFLIYSDFQSMIYSGVALYITTITANYIVLGANHNILINIYCINSEDIEDNIYKNYKIKPIAVSNNGDNKSLDYIFHKKEIENIKELVLQKDSKAVMYIIGLNSVSGLK